MITTDTRYLRELTMTKTKTMIHADVIEENAGRGLNYNIDLETTYSNVFKIYLGEVLEIKNWDNISKDLGWTLIQ